MMQNFKLLSDTPQTWLNTFALIYANAGEYLASLSFLDEALAVCETNRNTLHNIITILERMGQTDLTAEYRQLYHAAPRRIDNFYGRRHSCTKLSGRAICNQRRGPWLYGLPL